MVTKSQQKISPGEDSNSKSILDEFSIKREVKRGKSLNIWQIPEGELRLPEAAPHLPRRRSRLRSENGDWESVSGLGEAASCHRSIGGIGPGILTISPCAWGFNSSLHIKCANRLWVSLSKVIRWLWRVFFPFPFLLSFGSLCRRVVYKRRTKLTLT